MSLCLVAAGIAVQIAASTFTLAWAHTVERTAWEEDWRIAGGDLVLAEARVRGSGAGMEPPPQARLENGFYAWMPSAAPLEELVLRRAPQAGDWRLCAAGQCATIREWLGAEADPVRLFALEGEGGCVGDPPLQAGRSVIQSLRSGGNIVKELAGPADLRLHRCKLLPCQMEPLFGLGEFRIPQFRLGLLR